MNFEGKAVILTSYFFSVFAALSDPIDVYSDWIDECERINGGAEAWDPPSNEGSCDSSTVRALEFYRDLYRLLETLVVTALSERITEFFVCSVRLLLVVKGPKLKCPSTAWVVESYFLLGEEIKQMRSNITYVMGL